jgi:hypothetical protein
MKYRWLDDDHTVVSVVAKGSKAAWLRGQTGVIKVLPKPGCVGNCLVDFGGILVVCPAGTLRRER